MTPAARRYAAANDPARPPFEFDCAECGRHIVHFGTAGPAPALCAECRHLPGWFADDRLRGLLDPALLDPMPAPAPAAAPAPRQFHLAAIGRLRAAFHAPPRSPPSWRAHARWAR